MEKEVNCERFFLGTAYSIANPSHPEVNEDCIFFDEQKGCAGVFDGLGGIGRAELGSKRASEIIGSLGGKMRNTIQDRQVLNTIFKIASFEVSKTNSQTTAVFFKMFEKHDNKFGYIAHVGDSRAYILRDRKLSKLTQDDNDIPEEIAQRIDFACSSKDLSSDEFTAMEIKKEHVSQSLGSGRLLDVHIRQMNLYSGDSILLTSDGLHDNLSQFEIEKCLLDNNLNAKKLVNLAYEASLCKTFRSRPDDISAAVLEIV